MKIGGYGVALIAIGVLSYVIPMFGYQFRLVDLFDQITGGLGGILLIVVGIAIVGAGVYLQRPKS